MPRRGHSEDDFKSFARRWGRWVKNEDFRKRLGFFWQGRDDGKRRQGHEQTT